MSIYVFTGPRGQEVKFQTFSPEIEFRGGEVARKPIPVRTLQMARWLKAENPGLRVLISYEEVEVAHLISMRASLGIEVVAERKDQIQIGLDMPLEIFRGRLSYLINGHHRAVAAYDRKIDRHSAYVINTNERTKREADHFDPLSERVLCSPGVWELSKYQYPNFEPREERLSDFRKKLKRLCRHLDRKVSQVPTHPLTRNLRDLLVKMLAFEEFETTVDQLEFYFGLNLGDLQMVCLLRDALRSKWLYDRLQGIHSYSPQPDLQKKIDGLKLMSFLASALIPANQ